jgi:hypothetical protein
VVYRLICSTYSIIYEPMISTSELTKLTEISCFRVMHGINEVCRASHHVDELSNQIPLRYLRQIPPPRTIYSGMRPCCEICPCVQRPP